MDIFIPIVIFFVLFVFFSLCGMCCKRRRDQGAVIATPVVITSTQHHVGPYPVQVQNANAAPPPAGVIVQHHNSGTGVYPPQAMPQPMPGYNPTPGGYPPQPYPPQQPPPQHQPMQQMPMPMPMPMPGSAPPSVAAQTMMNPPSYDSVVTENYAKQAPYNPHYSGQ